MSINKNTLYPEAVFRDKVDSLKGISQRWTIDASVASDLYVTRGPWGNKVIGAINGLTTVRPLSIATFPEIEVEGAHSVCLWYKPNTSATQIYNIISKWTNGTNTSGWGMQQRIFDTIGVGFRLNSTNNWFGQTTSSVEIGKWSHIAYVYHGDGSTPDLYFNGVDETNFVSSTGNALNGIADSGDPLDLLGGQVESATSRGGDGAIADPMIFPRALTAEEIQAIYKGKSFDYMEDLLSSWAMDDINPKDVGWKQNGNDGTGVSIVSSNIVNGMAGGQSIEMDGSNDYVESDTQIISGYPFTLSGWIKTNAAPAGGQDEVIFSLVDLSQGDVFYSIRTNGGAGGNFEAVARNAAVAQNASSTTQIEIGEWYFVTGVFASATDRRIYVNAVEEGSNTTSVTFSSGVDRWSIGRNGRTGGTGPFGYVDGQLDHIHIFDSALTNIQIRDLYERERRGLSR